MTGEVTTPAPTADAAAALPAGAVETTTAVDEDAALGAAFDRVATNNGADRGEGGKFVSHKPAPEGAQGGDAPSQDGEGAGEADKPSPVAGTAAPAHLPQSTKDIWDKLTPEGQAEVARLTGEWDRKFGEQGKLLQTVKPIHDKLTEATAKFPDFKGMTPEQLAQGAIELGAVQVALSRNPVGTIIEIAKHYKVLPQLAQAFQGKESGEGQPGNDNTILSLQQEISALKDQLSKAANPETLRETVSTAFLERETEAMVQQFAAADGKDYWAEVEADMPLYIRHVMERGLAEGPKAILQKAYDMAINANPDVRARVRAAEAKATVSANDPKRTEAAKKAASINVPSNGSGKERQMTEDELLAAAYERKMAS